MLWWNYYSHAQSPNDCGLGDDEIIVEIFTLQKGNGQVEYMASVMKKDYDAPHTCFLFNETRLMSEMEKGEKLFTDTIMFAMLMTPINDELKRVKKIFFVPAGKLNLFAIEYCNAGDGQILAEKYDFYRLTSSNMLTHKSEMHRAYTTYTIFGGINFDATPDFEELYENEATKCRMGYLQDSYDAAVDIHHYLTDIGFCGTLFANDEATESALKTLPWYNNQIFFIETHSITYPVNGESDYPNSLLLAGASYALEGGIVPEGKEDGLLTTEEISNLDMKNVDLAVISACKSALCENDYQGAGGLMRAFKRAGVKSLVMTTDDVVDYVSGEVWKVFFKNLTRGKSKRESLLDAVKNVRLIHDGFYSSPRYWTPYILIDGLD